MILRFSKILISIIYFILHNIIALFNKTRNNPQCLVLYCHSILNSQEKKFGSPYIFSLNTERIQLGEYDIEARAYAKNADTEIMKSAALIAPPRNLKLKK